MLHGYIGSGWTLIEDANNGILKPIKFDPGSTSLYDDAATLTA